MLAAKDPAPFELINQSGTAPCLLVCDHASNSIPRSLGDLGMPPEHLERHIAWDIGAADMTRRLSERLNAPALLAGFSRLVVDCNRYTHDPAAFLDQSDGVSIPRNRALGGSHRQQRIDGIYSPYHQKIEDVLAAFTQCDVHPAFIAIHTMTDRMQDGAWRPQEFTLCWAKDFRFAGPVLDHVEKQGKQVGNNEPYSIDLGIDYTVPEHAMRRGLVHLQIEVRQDLVDDRVKATAWADLIYDAVRDLVFNDAFRTPKFYSLELPG